MPALPNRWCQLPYGPDPFVLKDSFTQILLFVRLVLFLDFNIAFLLLLLLFLFCFSWVGLGVGAGVFDFDCSSSPPPSSLPSHFHLVWVRFTNLCYPFFKTVSIFLFLFPFFFLLLFISIKVKSVAYFNIEHRTWLLYSFQLVHELVTIYCTIQPLKWLNSRRCYAFIPVIFFLLFFSFPFTRCW